MHQLGLHLHVNHMNFDFQVLRSKLTLTTVGQGHVMLITYRQQIETATSTRYYIQAALCWVLISQNHTQLEYNSHTIFN